MARFPAPAPRTRPDPVNGHEAAHRAIAGRLWAAAAPADDTPARAYLAGRSVWPPDGIGPGLPASVRWLPRGAAGRDVAADWYDVPEHTAGAIVYASGNPAAQRFERSAWTPWTRTGGGPASAGGAPSAKRKARRSWWVRWAAIPS